MYWKLREKKSVVVERQKGGGWIDDIDMLLLVTRFNSSTKYYFNTVIFIILPNIGLLPFPSMDSLREKGKEDGYNKDRLLVAFNFYESGKRSTKEWMLKTRHVALCFTFHGMSFPWVSFFFSFFFFPFSFLSCFYYYYLLTDGIRKFKKLIKNSNCSVPHIASPRPTPPCHPVWTNQNTSNLKSQLSSHSHFPLKINN